MPRVLAKLTVLPPLVNNASSAFMQFTRPFRLTLMMVVQSSSFMSLSAVPPTSLPKVPAMFAAPSSRPNFATVVCSQLATESALRTPTRVGRSPFVAPSVFREDLNVETLRLATEKLAPWESRMSTTARPMPEAPPVTAMFMMLLCEQWLGHRHPGTWGERLYIQHIL